MIFCNLSHGSSLCPKKIAASVVKDIFDQDFVQGVAFDEIIKESKRWLHNNGFSPVKILRQTDIPCGTMNYEGLSVLNDVEAATYKGKLKRIRDRVIPAPPCLQRLARILEKRGGGDVCPFKTIQIPFGESLEFDYAKMTRLVLNSFGLESVGKEHSINISASINAATLTEKLSHTSAG